jgi:hypothetical protein
VSRQALPADMDEPAVINANRGTDEGNRAAICPHFQRGLCNGWDCEKWHLLATDTTTPQLEQGQVLPALVSATDSVGAPVVSVGTRPGSASPWNGACVSTLPLSLDEILASVDFELFKQKLAKIIELLGEATPLLPYVHRMSTKVHGLLGCYENGRTRSFSQRRKLGNKYWSER